MRLNIGSLRLWLFCGLTAIAAGLMVTSAIMPWWTARIEPYQNVSPFSIVVYQYGIPSITGLAPEAYAYIIGDITPFYQTVLAWVYLAASVALILCSTWLKGRKGSWILAGVGLTYIAYAVVAVIWIAIRTGDFNISLQGYSDIVTYQGDQARVVTSLQFGYYLTYAAGGTCIALALLRNMIMGKPRLGGQ